MKFYCRSTVSISLLICLLFWCILDPSKGRAITTDNGPDSVSIDYLQELYEGVTFDHEMHAEMYSCARCHHHTTGGGSEDESCKRCHGSSASGQEVACSECHEYRVTPVTSPKDQTGISPYHIDKPQLKGAFHLQCLGCHQDNGVFSDCQGCHAFTPAGRKRFAVNH